MKGKCAGSSLGLFVDGVPLVNEIPGAAVGFFFGGGLPIFATTTSGGDCGQGSLWVTTGLPVPDTVVHILVTDRAVSVDIRNEAPDPWNPDTAPPFAW